LAREGSLQPFSFRLGAPLYRRENEMTKQEFMDGIQIMEVDGAKWGPHYGGDGKTYEQIWFAYAGLPNQDIEKFKYIYGRIEVTAEVFKKYLENDPESLKSYAFEVSVIKEEMFQTLLKEYPDGIEEVIPYGTV